MFSRLFKRKKHHSLDRLLRDKHVRFPCIACITSGHGMEERHVYIEDKQCNTIRFARIEVVSDPFISDPVLVNERKQYEGLQFCIPLQFHGQLHSCRKAISSIEEIPGEGVCSVVLRENALLLSEKDNAAVYVPSKTKLDVVSIERNDENKPVRAVFQDRKGDTYFAKDVTPLVAYILVHINCTTLERYVLGDNLRHSTVVTFQGIDENDVASNDLLELQKAQTILAGQVRIINIEDCDFIIGWSNNQKDHTIMLIPKEKLKNIHAKLTTFASDLGKEEFICNHFQGCSYVEVIASKLYTKDTEKSTVSHFSVKVPTHAEVRDTVYEPDPTLDRKTPRAQRFDSAPVEMPHCIDPRKTKSESDVITEDDVYEKVDGKPSTGPQTIEDRKQNTDNSKMTRYTVAQETFSSHFHDNTNIDDKLVKAQSDLNDKTKKPNRKPNSSLEDRTDFDDESLYLSPFSRQNTEVFTKRVEPENKPQVCNNVDSLCLPPLSSKTFAKQVSSDSKDDSDNKTDDQVTYEDTFFDLKEESVYMPMDGASSNRNSNDNCDYEDTDDVEALKNAKGQSGDYEQPDDVEALKIVKIQLNSSSCTREQDHKYHNTLITLDGSVKIYDVENDEVFKTGTTPSGIRKHRPSIHRKQNKSYKEHVQSIGENEKSSSYDDNVNTDTNRNNIFNTDSKDHKHPRTLNPVVTHIEQCNKYSSKRPKNDACESDKDEADAVEKRSGFKYNNIKHRAVLATENMDDNEPAHVLAAERRDECINDRPHKIDVNMQRDGKEDDDEMDVFDNSVENEDDDDGERIYGNVDYAEEDDLEKAIKAIANKRSETKLKEDNYDVCHLYDVPKSARPATEVFISEDINDDCQIYDAPKSARPVTEEYISSEIETDCQTYDTLMSARPVTKECINSEIKSDCQIYDAPTSARPVTKEFVNSELNSDCQIYDQSAYPVSEDFINTENETDFQMYDAPQSGRSFSKGFMGGETENDFQIYDAHKSAINVREDFIGSEIDCQIYDAPKSARPVTEQFISSKVKSDFETSLESDAGDFDENAEYGNIAEFRREGGVSLS